MEELSQLTQVCVTVLVKIICVDELIEVPGGNMKQDVQVGDSPGTVRVTFWEKEIGKVNVGKSYRLLGMVVRVYHGSASVPWQEDCGDATHWLVKLCRSLSEMFVDPC